MTGAAVSTLEPPPLLAQGAPFGHRLIPAGDPLSGATFDAIWDQKVRPELVRLEADRQRAVMIFAMALIAGALAAWAEYLFAPGLLRNRMGGVDFRLPLFTVIGAGALGFWPIRKVARTAKADVIAALCAPMNVTYQVGGQQAAAFDEFQRLRLLPHFTRKVFEDFFGGARGAVQFALCEARLTQSSGKSEVTVFRGQLLCLTTARRLLGTTVVLRDSGFLRGFSCPSGLEKVGLEDPAFEKVFEVFGSDQVEAREILTPTFMQHLMDLEQAWQGENLRCAFVGSELLVALESGDRFEIGSMFSSLVDRSRMESIARDIEQVFKLIDAFGGA